MSNTFRILSRFDLVYDYQGLMGRACFGQSTRWHCIMQDKPTMLGLSILEWDNFRWQVDTSKTTFWPNSLDNRQ